MTSHDAEIEALALDIAQRGKARAEWGKARAVRQVHMAEINLRWTTIALASASSELDGATATLAKFLARLDKAQQEGW